MGSYDFQYKSYYDGLKGKSVGTYKGLNSSFDDYLGRGSGLKSQRGKNKKSNGIFSGVVNWIALQFILTFMLFLLVFGAKYSSNPKLEGYYNVLESGIRNKYSITELKQDMTNVKLSTILTKVRDSIKWVSEKIDTNPLNE